MDLNQMKIELIQKLINAHLTEEERDEILAKAKEIVSREPSTENQLKNKKS
jgi:hypothetical protein